MVAVSWLETMPTKRDNIANPRVSSSEMNVNNKSELELEVQPNMLRSNRPLQVSLDLAKEALGFLALRNSNS